MVVKKDLIKGKRLNLHMVGNHHYPTKIVPGEYVQLTFIDEPENVFDRYAVKVLNENGEQLGHLLKSQARVVHGTKISGSTLGEVIYNYRFPAYWVTVTVD